MRRNLQAGLSRNGGLSLDVFSEDELAEIHLATLEVLAETGVFVEDAEALDVFDEGGCDVDRETRMVRIPGHVVEAAIRSAPSTFVLAARDPAQDYVMGGARVGFTNFGEGIKVIDVETGEVREPTKQDVADSARVVDALPDVDVYERAVGAHEVPQSSCNCTTPRPPSPTRASTSSWVPATVTCCAASWRWGPPWRAAPPPSRGGPSFRSSPAR